MDVMLALTTVDKALGVVKTIKDIDKEFDAAEYKLAIAELTSNLADVKIALADAHSEHQRLRDEILRLNKAFEFKGELVEEDGYKYRLNGDGNPTGNAFCVVCEQKEGRYFETTASRGFVEFSCPNCRTKFHKLKSFV